ncbi:MAG TPA: diguanylate cyclase [Deltaproteobacteria bacterium]|nr:diguanylate cyclase [Deltaproteobacteria bacterium]
MKSSFPVLIAEDDPVSRRLLEATLTKEGYEVVTAENGRKALETFENRFFPIVITDWMMPEMDGLDLTKSIRRKETSGYVFIFLLTAKSSKEDIIAGLEAGADDYLTKPFNRGELMARLKTATRILELEESLKKANEEIRLLSITDALTGCFNRAYMDETLPKEVKRSLRYGHPLSLIMGDIDHFKKVNDTYGHQAGDEILRRFVACLKNEIRQEIDWIARYGGEEFLLIFPETGFDRAMLVAERLRLKVSEMLIQHEERMISITVSFGVTCLPSTQANKDISYEEIIGLADEFLYEAKKAGRNRVIGHPVKCAQ